MRVSLRVVLGVVFGMEHARIARDAVVAFGAGEVAFFGVGLGGGPLLDEYPSDNDGEHDKRSNNGFEKHVILRCRRIP